MHGCRVLGLIRVHGLSSCSSCLLRLSAPATKFPPSRGFSGESKDKGKPPAPADKVKVVPKIKTRMIYDDSVKSHKYITPLRAASEYMLDYKALDQLTKYYSRSPYSYETRTLVYRRDEVEKLAYQKHGNKETLELRLRKALEQQQEENQKIFDLKRALKYFRHDMAAAVEDERFKNSDKEESLLKHDAGRVVVAAIAINSVNFLLKGVTWWYTGSKSMFSEMLHSLADTMNQIILAIGLHRSMQRPDKEHPYGYLSLRNISSLISGVAIFCLGAGISMHQGVMGVIHPEPIESHAWALLVLGGSFVSEGGTLILAYQQARRSARKAKVSLSEYVRAGYDPSTNVVLLEDAVAVLGVVIAGASMSVSALTDSPVWDALGGCAVAGLLACVAYFIIWSNAQTLIGKSIPAHQEEAIQRLVERSKVIRGTYDVKATIIGGDRVRFKAEVDIDGSALTQRYLETLSASELLTELKGIESEAGAAEFLMRHGDNIVNILGAEINNIEETIRKEFPYVKHIDIEIN